MFVTFIQLYNAYPQTSYILHLKIIIYTVSDNDDESPESSTSSSQAAPHDEDYIIDDINDAQEKQIIASMSEDEKRLICLQIISYNKFTLPASEMISEKKFNK